MTNPRDYQIGGDHYKNMAVEPWDVVDTWPIEQRIGAYRHGILKYVMRMGTKDEQVQELKKAQHYIHKLITVLEEDAKWRDEETERIGTWGTGSQEMTAETLATGLQVLTADKIAKVIHARSEK